MKAYQITVLFEDICPEMIQVMGVRFRRTASLLAG